MPCVSENGRAAPAPPPRFGIRFPLYGELQGGGLTEVPTCLPCDALQHPAPTPAPAAQHRGGVSEAWKPNQWKWASSFSGRGGKAEASGAATPWAPPGAVVTGVAQKQKYPHLAISPPSPRQVLRCEPPRNPAKPPCTASKAPFSRCGRKAKKKTPGQGSRERERQANTASKCCPGLSLTSCPEAGKRNRAPWPK